MLKFKRESDRAMFTLLHPVLIMIYSDMFLYAKNKYKVDLVITDTISTLDEDKKIGRTSSAHREGRALDIRTRDLDPFIVQDLCNYINSRWAYKEYHYLSKNGVKRLAYYHTHKGEHIHLAIHKNFANYNLHKHFANLLQ